MKSIDRGCSTVAIGPVIRGFVLVYSSHLTNIGAIVRNGASIIVLCDDGAIFCTPDYFIQQYPKNQQTSFNQAISKAIESYNFGFPISQSKDCDFEI
jgi:hypothetical protein